MRLSLRKKDLLGEEVVVRHLPMRPEQIEAEVGGRHGGDILVGRLRRLFLCDREPGTISKRTADAW